MDMKVTSHIRSLPPYTPIEPFEVLSQRLGRLPQEIIKLDANENPYGLSPRARQALAELPFAHIYPDPESRLLRAALAGFTGLPEEYLLAGAGVDELLDLLLRVVLEPGDAVLSCPPTFGMYAFDTHLNAGRLVEAPRRPDFSVDLPAVLNAVDAYHPKVLFLASPNNPDGSLLDGQVFESLVSLPLLLVLDEAYIEFSEQGRLGEQGTRLDQVPRRDNLVVLRTFSKWAGLAGLRVGYGAFPRWLLPDLWKAKQPYNVNVAASAAAIASLEDAGYLAGIVAGLIETRQQLYHSLCDIPYLQPYPSRSNFILARVNEAIWPGLEAQAPELAKEKSSTGAALKAYLASQGILLRYFDKPGLRDAVRISAGHPDEMNKLLETLWNLA